VAVQQGDPLNACCGKLPPCGFLGERQGGKFAVGRSFLDAEVCAPRHPLITRHRAAVLLSWDFDLFVGAFGDPAAQSGEAVSGDPGGSARVVGAGGGDHVGGVDRNATPTKKDPLGGCSPGGSRFPAKR
jgi:hypothetical protein